MIKDYFPSAGVEQEAPEIKDMETAIFKFGPPTTDNRGHTLSPQETNQLFTEFAGLSAGVEAQEEFTDED